MKLHDRLAEIQAHVEDEKEIQFLRLLARQAHGRTDETIHAGDAAEAMQLPFEEVLRLAQELEEERLLQRVGPLDVPHGPVVCLTQAGLRAAAA